jgi:hypothetical protein
MRLGLGPISAILLLLAGTTPAHAADEKAAPAKAHVPLARLHARPLQIADAKAAPAKPAKKAKEASCDVVEFQATKTGAKNVDAGLSKWKAELDQPPLSAFDTFKVTGQKSLSIAQGGASSVKITANLGLLFKGTVTENDKDRLQLEVTIDNAAGRRMYRSTTTQDSGASQILSAGKSGDANVFFVITCSAQ